VSACIEWAGARTSSGYGCRRQQGKLVYLHRLAWEDAHGPIPAGMFVCHRCDNPPCYNVEHLFLGTAADNNRDMYAKGRGRHGRGVLGSQHPLAKLTDEAVRDIRRRRAAGTPLRVLSAEYGVSIAGVSRVEHRQSWRHVA